MVSSHLECEQTVRSEGHLWCLFNFSTAPLGMSILRISSSQITNSKKRIGRTRPSENLKRKIRFFWQHLYRIEELVYDGHWMKGRRQH